MKFNELQVKAYKGRTRKGRGIAAGKGKTAGRGTKGQNARSGSGMRAGFEGGQNPLIRRLPKLRGFTSHKTPAQKVYTGQLDQIKAKAIDNAALFKAGLIKDEYHTTKLIVNGELKSAKDISMQFASETAIEAVQKTGGTFTKVPRPQRSVTEKRKEKKEARNKR